MARSSGLGAKQTLGLALGSAMCVRVCVRTRMLVWGAYMGMAM